MSRSIPSYRPSTILLGTALGIFVLLAFRPGIVGAIEAPFLALTVVIMTLVIIAAIWMLRQMRSQLDGLAAAARHIREGNHSSRCGIQGSGPIARLSKELDLLAQHIDETMAVIHANEVRIKRMAYHDDLTELPNRRFFKLLMDRQLAQADRLGNIVGIVILDFDHFKDINDSLGHRYGDLFLVAAAKRIQGLIRKSDLVARLGGDEFALLLTNAQHPEEFREVISRVVNGLRDPFQLDLKEIRTSVSAGVSFYPQDGNSTETLMRHADTALYQAKDQGRNNVRLFDSNRSNTIHKRAIIEHDFRVALEKDELTLHYQPLVGLEDGAILGLEALCRWEHPSVGKIMPDQFIAMAEQNGLMPALGMTVLRKACQQLVEWRDRGLKPVPISVNVSVRQLQTGDFVSQVKSLLSQNSLPPDLLHLEITENIAVENAERILEFLSSLNEIGIKVAIDDFGTGYSSFSYLREYKIDTLKIDKSFVSGLPDDPDSVAIVRAILSLSEALGLNVVAEGIELQSQLELLRNFGCHIGQGYLFCPPVPAEEHEMTLQLGHLSLSGRRAAI